MNNADPSRRPLLHSEARPRRGPYKAEAVTRLLVVEDDVRLGEALVDGLTRAQYTTDLALDGEAALAYAETATYDAIILDIMLPKLDGFAVCQHLRADGVWTPILMLTARDAIRDRIAGLDA